MIKLSNLLYSNQLPVLEDIVSKGDWTKFQPIWIKDNNFFIPLETRLDGEFTHVLGFRVENDTEYSIPDAFQLAHRQYLKKI